MDEPTPDAFLLTYRVGARLSFSESELETLILCAKTHYDRACNLAGTKRGEAAWGITVSENGFLAAASMRMETFGGLCVELDLSTRKLDLCLKILEQARLLGDRIAGGSAESARVKVRAALVAATQEQTRLDLDAAPVPFFR